MTSALAESAGPWRPRVARPHDLIDLSRAQAAATELLNAFGLDLSNPSLEDTPRRFVAAYAELLTAPPFDMTTFPNDGGARELVLVEDLPVRSVCEHHLLPFTGVVVVAEHTCMTLRGARAGGSCTVTTALRGVLGEHGPERDEFLASTRQLARSDRRQA